MELALGVSVLQLATNEVTPRKISTIFFTVIIWNWFDEMV